MKIEFKKAFWIGVTIGFAFWIFIYAALLYELYNRIFNDSGDPIVVLTALIGLGILSKLSMMNQRFIEIVDWIRK